VGQIDGLRDQGTGLGEIGKKLFPGRGGLRGSLQVGRLRTVVMRYRQLMSAKRSSGGKTMKWAIFGIRTLPGDRRHRKLVNEEHSP